MKLLILTQYFPPETGAPQNRLYELAVRLKRLGVDVTVLTAMPNYPKMEIFPAYVGKKTVTEAMDGITVHRTAIKVFKNAGIVKRLRNYFSFVKSSKKFGKTLGHFDFIFCESPPLFLGYTAIYLSKKLNAKLIFNVSDLWPESAEKLGLVKNRLFLRMAYRLESRCYGNSFLITGQTKGIAADIRKRFPKKNVLWLPNGADISKCNPVNVNPSGFRDKYGISRTDTVFFYGGILGHAQGLSTIIEASKNFKTTPDIKFVLMGTGPEKQKLMQLAGTEEVKNIIFAEPVGREGILGVISEIDISIVPLRNIPLFLGAIPSKIFETLAMQKPILLGVKGEARNLFIDHADAGWAFEPENSDDLSLQIRNILSDRKSWSIKGMNGRNYVARHFDLDAIAKKLLDQINIPPLN